MYEELKRKQLMLEIKSLLEQIEEIDDKIDFNTDFVKRKILDTYSVN